MNTNYRMPGAFTYSIASIASIGRSTCLLIVSTFLMSISGFAQVTLSIGSVIAPKNATIEIPVTVTNFDSITGFQLSFGWNGDILEYTGITNFNLDKQENVDEFNPSSGALGILWWANDPDVGYSVADGTSIFSLNFNVIGEIGDTTILAWTDDPMELEVINVALQAVPLNLNEGMVIVDEESSVIPFTTDNISIRIVPNPCKDYCLVTVDSNKDGTANFQIIDMAGHAYYQQQFNLRQGQQEVNLPIGDSIPNGQYLLIVETQGTRSLHKLVIQN